jgi:hypothetical protein
MPGEKVVPAVDGSSKSSMRLETKQPLLNLVGCEVKPIEHRPPALITPSASPIPMRGRETPDYHTSSPSEIEELYGVSIQGALQQARSEAEPSAQSLERLSEGIRAVKRILERCASDEDDIRESSTKDIQQVHELSSKLHGILGSDLMALINSADMIREHSKLAFQETSEVVTDLNKVKLQAEEAANRAKQARKVGRKLFEENLELHGEIYGLRREKRLLVKEVKILRAEAAETRKFDSWRLLEQHVIGSMAIHEMVMKTPTSPKLNIFREGDSSFRTNTPNKDERQTQSNEKDVCFSSDESEETNTSNEEQTKAFGMGGKFSSFRGTSRYRKTALSCSTTPSLEENPKEAYSFKGAAVEAEGPAKTDLGSPGLRTKSPVPSLGENSSDSSATKTHKNVDAGSDIDQSGETIFPTNAAFHPIDGDGPMPQPLVSPLFTPNEYVDNIVEQDYKPICDPNILRTLAIPSTEQRSVACNDLSPRKQVSESLFEC